MYQVVDFSKAIPYIIRRKGNFVYAEGNNRFQCRETRTVMSEKDSKLFYQMSQQHIKYFRRMNLTALKMGIFNIGEHKCYLMKMKMLIEDRKKDTWGGNWNGGWVVPVECCEEINQITHD